MRRSLLRLLATSSLLLALASAETRPRYGGTLHVELRSEWTGSLRALVFENLTTVDDGGNPQPQLATSWEAQNSERRWQFWLRRNVRFHDGTPMTAALVTASLTAGECEACPWMAVRAVGDSVVFEFRDPRPQFAAEVALSQYAIQHAAPDGKLVGTGPFRVAARAANGPTVLEANSDHWNGRPFLDAIEVLDNRSERDQLMDFDVGRADAIETAPDSNRRLRTTARTPAARPTELIALTIGAGKPALQDVRLRQAIALTVDRASLHNVVLQKQGEVASGLLPNWMTGYGFLLPHTRDLARAQQLVRETGRPAPLTIAADRRDPVLRLIAERIAVNASDAGIPIAMAAENNTADLVVTRLSLQSSNPGVALNELLRHFTTAPAGAPPESLQATYGDELEPLVNYRLVPLAYVPRAYALAPRVRNWSQTAEGRAKLEDVWLAL